MILRRFVLQAPEGDGGGAGGGASNGGGGAGQGSGAGSAGSGSGGGASGSGGAAGAAGNASAGSGAGAQSSFSGAGDQGGAGGQGGQGGQGGGSPAGGTVPEWASGVQDAELKNWLAKKGERWGSMEDMVRSHRQLEAFRGVPETQLLKLEDATNREAWHGPGGIYERLGRPPTADKYELPEVEDREGYFNLTKPFRELAYEEGLSATQAKNISEKINTQLMEFEQQQIAEFYHRQEKEIGALKKEWGDDFAANEAVALNGALALGFDPKTPEGQKMLANLEREIGTRNIHLKMYEIGSRLGEHGAGSHGNQGGMNAPTPDQALSEIRRLESDPEFMKRYNSPDGVAENERMRFLYKMAYPEGV